ncbi:MAG TPA: uroporphyrinogen-III C-methyltransferase [Casimicrobiaceae bacterium]|jgi:uroporphyrin-3 C-methyltransferase
MQDFPESDRGAAPAPPDGAAAASVAGSSPRETSRLAGIALIVTIAVAAAALYGWLDLRREVRDLRANVAQRLTAADSAIAEARGRDSDLSNALRDSQAKLAVLEARLAESQSQQASLEALYREIAPSRDELALTEVEQVLSLASQQLTLAGNVQAALAAVQLADAKLARLDRPQFTALRRELARDMDRLKAVPYVDVAGISLKLDQTLDAIERLPLARDERLPEPPHAARDANEPQWRRLLRDAWAELRSLVRIEVSDRPAAPLLTPQEDYFLRENLRLRLLAARLALLSRDERAFRTDLNAAHEWMERYLDTRQKNVQAAIATVAQLAATPMAAEMPDLSRSLEAVRTLRAAGEHAERAAATPAAPSTRAK